MTSKPVYLINKDASYRLDSERIPGEQFICLTMASLARSTQQWLITDDRLITTLDGSQALTFQAGKLTLQPPRNNDKSQKWIITKEGVLQCELNNYSLQSEPLITISPFLPFNVAQSVVFRTSSSTSAPLENEKWTVEYVDGSGSANDLLEKKKIVDYRPLIAKKGDAEPKNYRCFGSNDAGSFDYNPAKVFSQGKFYKEPRINFIVYTWKSSPYMPLFLKLTWQDLYADTEIQRKRIRDKLGEKNGYFHPLYGGSQCYYTNSREQQLWDTGSINIKKYLTKITGIWCCIEGHRQQANYRGRGRISNDFSSVTFCGFTSLKFEANDGSFLLSPPPEAVCHSDASSNNMGCPYRMNPGDHSLHYSASNVGNRVSIGQTVPLPYNRALTGTLKDKHIVILEADPGYEIVGFYGRMSRARAFYQRYKTISQLGIYQRPASTDVDLARYS